MVMDEDGLVAYFDYVKSTKEEYTLEHTDQVLVNVHSARTCQGPTCTIHNRSDHDMRHLPQAFELGTMWRVSEEGVHFLDPDDPNYSVALELDGLTEKEIIIRNSAKCLGCGDEIVSAFRHDFRTCSCSSLSVDGGTAYSRRLFSDDIPWEDTSITKKLVFQLYS